MSDVMVPYLNPQVMEVIFSNLDGKSLARCEQVCKMWKELVQSLSQRTPIWKTCCEEEINRDVRLELLNNCYPSWHISCPSNSNWRVVYKNWCQWHHVGRWAYVTKTVFEEDTSLRRITCMKISGVCVVTGHDNGDLFLWSYNDCTKLTTHKRRVTDLGMIVYSGECKNNSRLKHDYVVSTSLDCTVQVNPLISQEKKPCGFPIVVQEHRLPTVHVRVFENVFAVLSDDERVSIWSLNASIYNKKIPEVIKLHTLRTNIDPFQAISIWGSKAIQVSAMTSKGLCMPIFRGGHSRPYKLLQEEAQDLSSPDMWKEIHGRILKVFLWRYGVSIVLTDQRYMYATVNGCRQTKYNTMPYFHSYPVTVLLYGEILLLGMESGTLCMYLLSQMSDLLTLDLEAVYWEHSLCSDPIMALDISETINGPVIAAATSEKVYCIPFIPPQLR